MNLIHQESALIFKHFAIPLKHSKIYMSSFTFVPKCGSVIKEDLEKLRGFLDNSCSMSVLTGAGVSTESGIPDYRSEAVGLYARSSRRPVLYRDFCNSETIRRRYWARNYVGWPRFSSFKPNDTHKSLKSLENMNKVKCIITQNVDNLHTKAGSTDVIELHGTAYRVVCLGCHNQIDRFEFQNILSELNPTMSKASEMIRPDGDVDLSQEQVEGFIVPPCPSCGGILKPDIVFFGDNVPRKIVESVSNNMKLSDSLLILGTSLSTYSGYRIVLQALDAQIPIALVNIGKTRADDNVSFKVEGRCGSVLSKVTALHEERICY